MRRVDVDEGSGVGFGFFDLGEWVGAASLRVKVGLLVMGEKSDLGGDEDGD